MNHLEKMLLKHEGLRLKPYLCSEGKTTIGIGHNLDDKGITEKQAYVLLRDDIDDCIKDLAPYTWFKDLNMPRQDALINMCFNLGINRLLKFKNMVQALEVHDYEEAAKQALDSKWATQVGKRAFELAEIIKSGEYSG